MRTNLRGENGLANSGASEPSAEEVIGGGGSPIFGLADSKMKFKNILFDENDNGRTMNPVNRTVQAVKGALAYYRY